MEERVEGRMKGSEGERWVTPSPALRTRGIRTSGMIRHSVAFRAEQQRETSRPLPGTPSVEEQDTGPYGLVDASYLYEDCYKSQEDDDNSFFNDLTLTNYDMVRNPGSKEAEDELHL